jgi:tight adherence protein B
MGVATALPNALRRGGRGRLRLRRLFEHKAAPAVQVLHPLAVAVLLHRASQDRRWGAVVVGTIAVATGLAGLSAAGPVAAAVAGLYAASGMVVVLRRFVAARHAQSRAAVLDAVTGLAAQARAGTSLAAATDVVQAQLDAAVGDEARRVARRLASAVELAETSGAPLADVLDRLDAHLRAMDRARTAGRAQAAGVRASIVLLAVLPLAGIGLGPLVGVDPVRILLHTPLGAACLALAVLLQLGGIVWSARMTRAEVAV